MIRINLLPARVSKKKQAGKQQLVLFALVLVAGLVANYVWASSRAGDLETRQKRLARTKADIAQLDKIIGEVKSLREEQKALKEKLDVLAKLKQGRTGPVRMLDELATITPKRLWLRKMDDKAGKVTFDGTAATIDDVSVFMSALKTSRYFGDVELKKTTAKNDGKYRVVEFNIGATSRYSPAAATADGKAAPAPAAAKAKAKAGG
jgi:type IV pilus assembly protein PilN